MAGYAISINSRRAQKHLEAAADAARRMRTAFADCGEAMLRSVNQTFAAEGRPQHWAPLEATTLWHKVGGVRKATKKRGGGLKKAAARKLAGNKILTDTARLRRSIHYRAYADHVQVGTNVIYARAHQMGYAPRNLPARPFLVVQNEDRTRFRRILLHHIVEPFTR